MDEIRPNVAETAAALAQEIEPAHVIKFTTPDMVDAMFGVVKRGDCWERVDLQDVADKFRWMPRRKRGTAKAFSIDSFIALVNRHKGTASAIFGDIIGETPKLTAVLDYHSFASAPSFSEHRVVYDFPMSPEWKAWRAKNGVSMTQIEFALWLEEHLPEMASPTPDERTQYEAMMGGSFGTPSQIALLSRGLTVHETSKVSEINVLQSGEGSIQFEVEHQTKNADGKAVKVPGMFMLSIPLFVGGAALRIPARLRYRSNGGKITWLYQLYRPTEFLRAALASDLAKAADRTELPAFEGAPEA